MERVMGQAVYQISISWPFCSLTVAAQLYCSRFKLIDEFVIKTIFGLNKLGTNTERDNFQRHQKNYHQAHQDDGINNSSFVFNH